MSEAILKALMQLFALIVDIDEVQQISEREKDIVKAFLSRQLSSELVDHYMQVFERYLNHYHQEQIAKGSRKERKRTSLTAVRILGICEQINEELEQKQKVYVIIQLIEYIAYGIEIREKELDFLLTVATAFNIPDDEYSCRNGTHAKQKRYYGTQPVHKPETKDQQGSKALHELTCSLNPGLPRRTSDQDPLAM